MIRTLFSVVCILIYACVAAADDTSAPIAKTKSVFFSAEHRKLAARNIANHAWAADIKRQAIAEAEPFLKMNDDELWSLMFGNTIKRSWMVWSNGHCPACKKSVPMYTWKIDALKQPWKVECPHCSELFPKNDFYAFYKSGLDAGGVFDPAKANRELLVNEKHAAPGDALRGFGVDDGEGYVDGEKRWRFIGAYLIYGHWKQLLVGGARKLAGAYAVTGDAKYARKAGILLDRIADLYPTFDFKAQGVMYDKTEHQAAGYVSTWHDACSETRDLVLSYDQVFDAIAKDAELVKFLSGKASAHGLKNPKATFADVQRNIEGGILRDALANRPKIQSNFPQTDFANAVILATLAWPHNREEVYSLVDSTITTATEVDGLTGEKGLPGYTAYATAGLGWMLTYFNRLDAGFIEHALEKVPNLKKTYRFHIDTWALLKYYPSTGDGGNFVEPIEQYKGLAMAQKPGIQPSNYTLLWQLYERLGDAGYAQVMYGANGNKTANLPYDICAENPAELQNELGEIIKQAGSTPEQRSVNYPDWKIALLRAGKGKQERVLWLDYDSGGRHAHADGLNLGLYGYGIDLMPEFGYPPVQYGGWEAPRARWYTSTAAHNTVVVDGKNHVNGGGKASMFANGKLVQAITANAPVSGQSGVFERTAAMIGLPGEGFYVVDFFRVGGGAKHQKFMQSHFGTITTEGLGMEPAGDYLKSAHMRNWVRDARPGTEEPWTLEWKIEDRMGARKTSDPLHLRYTDLTTSAGRFAHEGWISYGGFNKNLEEWIPRVMVERSATTAGLESTFVAVIEPFESQSRISSIRRVNGDAEVTSESAGVVVLEVELVDGGRHIVTFNPGGKMIPGAVKTDAKLSVVQLKGRSRTAGAVVDGAVDSVVLCKGKTLEGLGAVVRLENAAEISEVLFEGGRMRMVTGDLENLVEARRTGN